MGWHVSSHIPVQYTSVRVSIIDSIKVSRLVRKKKWSLVVWTHSVSLVAEDISKHVRADFGRYIQES